jgi:hypothetical protein
MKKKFHGSESKCKLKHNGRKQQIKIFFGLIFTIAIGHIRTVPEQSLGDYATKLTGPFLCYRPTHNSYIIYVLKSIFIVLLESHP